MDGATQTGVGDGVTPARALAFARRLTTSGFDLDSKALLRLNQLLFLLIERGEWPDDACQLRSLMAPAICTSADQQAEFYLLFNEFVKRPEAPDVDDRAPELAGEQAKAAERSARAPVWRRWFVIGPIAAALVSLILVLSLEIPKGPAPSVAAPPLPPVGAIDQPPPGTVATAPANGPVSIQGRVVDKQSGNELAGALVRYLGTSVHDTGKSGNLVVNAPEDDSFWMLATRDGYQPALKLREQGSLDPFTVEMLADPPSSGSPPVTTVPLTGWRGWAWAHRSWLEGLAAAVPALALAGWWVLLYYRRLRLRKFLLPLNLNVYRLRAKSAADKLLKSHTVRNSAREFRLRRPRLSNELDEAATVDSSIRNGTRFTPVPARARLEPEYLVLIERLGPRDQQARFYDELMKRLESRDVTVDRYFFAGDPRECVRDDRRFSISELAALHPHHDLWIVTDSDKFLNRVTGEPAEWVAHLGQWTERAVLTSSAHNPYADWLLRQQDFRLVTADPAGLALLPGTIARTKESSFVPRWDAFPAMLRGDSARWVSDSEPSAADKAELFTQVRRFLGAPGYDCLSACAVYPAMSWNLTVELVASMAEGEAPEPILARLVRLPWFRRGIMPEWLRTRLAQRLPEAAERKAYAAIGQFIDNSIGLRGKASEWLEFGRLTANERALLFFKRGVRQAGIVQDYVFLSFLWKQQVGPIAPGAPSWLRRKLFRNGYAMFGARPVAHAVLAMLALLVGSGGGWAASAAVSTWKPVVFSPPELAYPTGFRGAVLDVARAMAGDSTGVPDAGFVNWCELTAAEILGRKPEFEFTDVSPNLLPGDRVFVSGTEDAALEAGMNSPSFDVLGQQNGAVGWFYPSPSEGPAGRIIDPPAVSPVVPKDYLPTIVDWSSQMSPVRTDTTNRNATGIAMAEVEEFLIRKHLHKTLLLDALYISNEARAVASQTNPAQVPVRNSSEPALEDDARELVQTGVIAQNALQFGQGHPSMIDPGPHYRVRGFRKLADLDSIRMALAAGPVVASFEIASTYSTGSKLANVRVPVAGRQVKVGVQVTDGPVAVVGYDDQLKQLKFMGISGAGWGDHGYGYVPYADVTRVNGIALSGVTMTPAEATPQGTGSTAAQTPTGQCAGPEIMAFDNMNKDAVQNSGTAPAFEMGDFKGIRLPFCLVSITTFHWNGGKGDPPGTVGLTDPSGQYFVGPARAVGSSGQGGAPNVNWTATFSGQLIVRPDLYQVRDSAPATWSQNSGSGGNGFARVVVRQYCSPGQGGSCGGQGAGGASGGVAGGVASGRGDPASQLRALGWTITDLSGGKLEAHISQRALPAPRSYELLRNMSGLDTVEISVTDSSDVAAGLRPGDMQALGSLTEISRLLLAVPGISDISALGGMRNLTLLDIQLSHISNISPLKNLTRLTLLELGSTDLSDIAVLRDLTSLTSLDLHGTPVRDLSPLANLKNLNDLMLASTKVADLSPLRGLRNLTSLSLGTTAVTDVSPLKGMMKLASLDLNHTGVTDVSPLVGLKSLTSLDLTGTKVSNAAVLKKQLPNLKITGP